MNNQKQKQPKKLSNISLGIIAVAMIGMVLPSLLSANAQNTTGSIDVESVKSYLDEAKKAFDSGNYAEALKHIDLAEEQLDIADDLIEVKLGKSD